MAARTVSRSEALRSPAQIPLRSAPATAVPEAIRTGRIPLADSRPTVPGGFDAKAFAGEVVPFSVIAFREGHDRIGVHVRLTAPDGAQTLHRLTPLNDGTDRWEAEIALDLRGLWRYRGMVGYTSAGTGTSIVDVRLNCPPEVTLHRLRAQSVASSIRPVANTRSEQKA